VTVARPTLLFVSDTTVGGSGRSQRELARALVRMGYRVEFLVGNEQPERLTRWLYAQLSDGAARLESTVLGPAAAWAEGRVGRRIGRLHLDGTEHLTCAIPQNALGKVLDRVRPDVVVCNSVERLTWRRVHRVASRRAMPTVLYIREVDSLDHLRSGAVPTALVANAESLRRTMTERGHPCWFVPSVIDVGVTRTDSTRRVALSINPTATKGGAFVWELARRCPEIPFVVQESWPLDAAELAAVQAEVATLPNVEFRRAAPPGPALYGDTRVLLVPYRVDSRPRVIAEAQANGLPVLVADVSALVEAIGDGGVAVGLDDLDGWARELRSLFNDDERYARLSAAALGHSRRPDIDPDEVGGSFAAIIDSIVPGSGVGAVATPKRSRQQGALMRHSRAAAFDTAIDRSATGDPARHWSALAPDPNAVDVIVHRARRLAAAWADPVPDRIAFLEARCRGRRVLDIGCVAHSTERMRDASWLHGRLARVAGTCLGVDVLPEAVELMNRSGYEVVLHDITTGAGPLEDRGPFDVIVAGELIEHIPSVDALFRLAAALLAPDGIMVLTTPNPYAPHRVRAGQRGVVWENVDHIVYAFPSGVAELCDRNGLVLGEARVTEERSDLTVRSVLRSSKRWIRGAGWRNVGVGTAGEFRQASVEPGELGRALRSMLPTRRRFVGESFIYVVRRADALSAAGPTNGDR